MRFVHGEQGKRNADMIVEIALGIGHFKLASKTNGNSSFVVVFPLVPVIPTTGIFNLRRW